MNNKAVNELGFCRIRRIKQIEEGVIHRGRLLNSLYPTRPHSLIANYNLLCPYNNPIEGDKSDI